MGKSVWYDEKDIVAFNSGKVAALTGKPRVPSAQCVSYNEKAAFNDGWDTHAPYVPKPLSMVRRLPF